MKRARKRPIEFPGIWVISWNSGQRISPAIKTIIHMIAPLSKKNHTLNAGSVGITLFCFFYKLLLHLFSLFLSHYSAYIVEYQPNSEAKGSPIMTYGL